MRRRLFALPAPVWFAVGEAKNQEGVRAVKKFFVLTSALAIVAVCLALLAGQSDIRRFLRMHNM